MSTMMRVSMALKDVAGRLDADLARVAGEKVTFSLFVWTAPQCSYIGTAARPEVIQILETMIARWKNGMPDVPVHEVISAGADLGRDSPYEPLRLAAEAVMRTILDRVQQSAATGADVVSLMPPHERALFLALQQLGKTDLGGPRA